MPPRCRLRRENKLREHPANDAHLPPMPPTPRRAAHRSPAGRAGAQSRRAAAAVNSVRDILAEIAALPLRDDVRILNLCGDQERVISLSEMRHLLPSRVHLLAGPGCAASVCPEVDVFQAIRLATGHPVTLLVAETLLRQPLSRLPMGPRSLRQAHLDGADVRAVAAPLQALMAADAEPDRQMVYFVAGFETLLAPLAGMILEGLPPNLSVLLCGRRAEPLIESLLTTPGSLIDGLILPGNRCALTGTDDWSRLSAQCRTPAAVAGYTVSSILAAVLAVLQQRIAGVARVDNCYRSIARPEGNAIARDSMFRVFELAEGGWRGLGNIGGSAFRLRRAYDSVNADTRFPDYRGELQADPGHMPDGCQCQEVLLGRMPPTECRQFAVGCTPTSPYGPCMASEDGYCFLFPTGRGLT